MSSAGPHMPNLRDARGIVHLGHEHEVLTRCGLDYTLGVEFAKPWPSSVIVQHMKRCDDTPTCVFCVGSP